jgi:hypothetical protein
MEAVGRNPSYMSSLASLDYYALVLEVGLVVLYM